MTPAFATFSKLEHPLCVWRVLSVHARLPRSYPLRRRKNLAKGDKLSFEMLAASRRSKRALSPYHFARLKVFSITANFPNISPQPEMVSLASIFLFSFCFFIFGESSARPQLRDTQAYRTRLLVESSSTAALFLSWTGIKNRNLQYPANFRLTGLSRVAKLMNYSGSLQKGIKPSVAKRSNLQRASGGERIADATKETKAFFKSAPADLSPPYLLSPFKPLSRLAAFRQTHKFEAVFLKKKCHHSLPKKSTCI